MSTSKIIVDGLYPTISKSLSDKKKTEKLKKDIWNYVDRNIEKLSSPGPIQRTLFTEHDMQKLYEAAGVTEQQVKEVVKKNKNIKSHWSFMNKPFNPVSALSIRYYTLSKNEGMVNTLLQYLTLSVYPSLHKKYFKYEPNENVMAYTINNLSKKFKIKQYGTIFATMTATTTVCYEHHKEKLIRGYDKDIVDFLMDVKTRQNSLIQGIAVEFYKNKEQNLYLNTEEDSFDEENYHESDSNSYAIERLTNKVLLKLTVEGPNMTLVSIAARWANVSVNELRNYTNKMITNEKRDDIRGIIESILFLYLFDDKNKVEEVHSNKFCLYCLEMYKKSNTSDENILKIKRILDSWLDELGTYKKTQRLATINNFRRGLFMFFVVSIMKTS